VEARSPPVNLVGEESGKPSLTASRRSIPWLV
jgi:hypothetical protein